MKNVVELLMEITLNVCIAFGNVAPFIILILLILLPKKSLFSHVFNFVLHGLKVYFRGISLFWFGLIPRYFVELL